jgi:hypothetical protein
MITVRREQLTGRSQQNWQHPDIRNGALPADLETINEAISGYLIVRACLRILQEYFTAIRHENTFANCA